MWPANRTRVRYVLQFLLHRYHQLDVNPLVIIVAAVTRLCWNSREHRLEAGDSLQRQVLGTALRCRSGCIIFDRIQERDQLPDVIQSRVWHCSGGICHVLFINCIYRSQQVNIARVFRVKRKLDEHLFRSEVGNVTQLYHASKAHNIMGILSRCLVHTDCFLDRIQLMTITSNAQQYCFPLVRGLVMPNIVVEDFGVDRSDPGLLGQAIYFANAVRYLFISYVYIAVR